MDVVYILGQASLAGDEEIKYSVRSLQENMLDLGAIYVVGDKPVKLPLVKHIPAQDVHEKRWKNMLDKVRMACRDEQLSDEFLLMNDDFFMLVPFRGDEFPFYKKKIGDGGPNGMYNFAIHCAVRLKKDWFLQMPLSSEMTGDFSPRSFYCNFFRAPGTPTDDKILRLGVGMPSIDAQLGSAEWFSIDDAAMIDQDFLHWISERWPTPSTFE